MKRKANKEWEWVNAAEIKKNTAKWTRTHTHKHITITNNENNNIQSLSSVYASEATDTQKPYSLS